MTQHLPSWYPPPDENGDIVVMQAPTINRTQIDSTGGSSDALLADALIDLYAGSISTFIQASRRNYALGIVSIYDRALELPGLSIRHQVQQRREIVTLTPRPSASNAPIDLNFDGYIAWVHNSGFAGEGPYDVFLNGYRVFKDVTVGTSPIGCVMGFGKTVLKCQSLHNKQNPLKLLPKVLPPRATIKSSGNIPGHDDLLGYFVFDWADPFAPDDEAYIGPPDSLWRLNPESIDTITWTKTTLFPRSGNDSTTGQPLSPLNIKKMNQIVVQLSDDAGSKVPDTPGIGSEDYILAEFYDRGSFRTVYQSWHYTGGTILVNDKPLICMGTIASQVPDIIS